LFLGDALTQVVVTPTLLYWFTRGPGGQRPHLGESIVMYVCLVLALFVGLVVNHPSYLLIFVYLPIPFLILAAVRLGPFGTANSLTLIAIVSMIAAVGGTGVFAGQSPDQAMLLIQWVDTSSLMRSRRLERASVQLFRCVCASARPSSQEAKPVRAIRWGC
jgi:integral membrane sensor domain MASE1